MATATKKPAPSKSGKVKLEPMNDKVVVSRDEAEDYARAPHFLLMAWRRPSDAPDDRVRA